MANFQKIPVKTFYLKLDGLISKASNKLNAVEWINPNPEDYLTLYNQVGKAWGWTGRLLLNETELLNKLHTPENRIWRCYHQNKLVGFFENDYSENGKTEIVYLGLLPEYIGKGLGRSLLNVAIQHASIAGENEVWLHTCEYDHKNALDFYVSVGFVVVQEKTEHEYYPINFPEALEK